jgi:hypothetical protein
MSERPSVDPKCYDLAEHFLADLPGNSTQKIRSKPPDDGEERIPL